MDRPSKEAVEGALAHYAEEAHCAIERNCAGILADEVRALREELDAAKGAVLYHTCLELKATIARVAALLPKWDAKGFVNLVDQMATTECINELEAALKGKGP